MTLRNLEYWETHGKPYRLCQPATDLRSTLVSHGLVVFHYPDQDHLEADPPEDHDPFSWTGWPIESAYGVGHALDIMRRDDSDRARAENANIARRLIFDKDAGHPACRAIKYINWTDERGVCTHVSWQPTKAIRSSTDKGHVHISFRSDMDDWTGMAGYDPMGGLVTKEEMQGIADTLLATRIKGKTAEGKDFDFSVRDFIVGTNQAAWIAAGPDTQEIGMLGQILTAIGEISSADPEAVADEIGERIQNG